jgi:hypothetical protein
LGKCIHHPDRDTRYLCMKHDIYLCEECLQCKDPKIYCKFRPSCPIWFMSKRKEGLETDEKRKPPGYVLGESGESDVTPPDAPCSILIDEGGW